jgi:hypothetical protein
MGIFSKKKAIDLSSVIERPTPANERRIAMLMQVAAMNATVSPELSLEIMQDLPSHPQIWRTKGWCYATLEDLDKALEAFDAGFAAGDVRCGVYGHRLLREHSSDEARFHAMEDALAPYFRSRDNELLLAQAVLSVTKGDFVAAFTNYCTFVSGDTNYAAGAGAAMFRAYQALIEEILDRTVSDRENVSEEETEAWFEAIDNFFDEEIKTAEGEGLGWNNFFFVVFMARAVERELKAGIYESASVLPTLNQLYQEMIEMINPPKHPETFSVEEIARALLLAIDKGDIFALVDAAPAFFEENDIPLDLIKKYQDEFEEWGFTQYLNPEF